jgi:predicted alpha/beta-fold hydrolase
MIAPLTPPTYPVAEPLILFPPFHPPRWARNGHVQTLAGMFWRVRAPLPPPTRLHWVELPDGDRLALHENLPDGWTPSAACALLVHGLGGCHRSRYLVRIAAKLVHRGVRVFRVDLRGCGAGYHHAHHPYHAGRWEDIAATVETVWRMIEAAPLGVAGFSLGGSLVLRWLGECPSGAARLATRALAVNPPVDLAASTQAISRAAGGLYDRYFARTLYRHVRGNFQWNPDSPLAQRGRPPATLIEFDDLFTAPLCGFGTAENYYQQASAAPLVPRIETPTLLLSAANDPLIPPETLTALPRPAAVQLHLAAGGGHLGYLAGATTDPDRHWLDWRVIEWLTGRDSR